MTHPHTRFKPSRLAVAIDRAQGFGLLEAMLALGIVSAVSLAAFVAFKVTDTKAAVRNETDALEQSALNIERSIGMLGNYNNLTTALVRRDDLASDVYKRSGSGLVNAWGNPVSFHPATVNTGGDAFLVETQVPASACAGLAASMASRAWDVRVDNVSVMASEGQLDIAAAGDACERGSGRMGFVFYSGLVAGTAVAAPPLALPPAVPTVTAPTSAPVGTPVGPVGPVGGAAPVAPVSSAPVAPPATVSPALPPAPTPVSPNTPPAPAVPAPSSPVSSVAACVIPPTENRSVATCPAGTWGLTNQERRWWCGEIGGNYEAWEAPQAGAWTDTSNTCTACPAPFPQSEQQWVNAWSDCPVGQTGSITWQAEQSRTRTGSYNCPAGSTALPAPTFTGWSGWSNTGATRNLVNTCATAVVGNVGWWHDGLGYVAGFAGNKCVRTYEVTYQLLVTNAPIGGYTAWYRDFPGEGEWKPILPSNPCNLTWDTPGTPYPQFPSDVMPTP